jgi:hypothetical protein
MENAVPMENAVLAFTPEEVVSALYQVMFDREPDETGLKSHCKKIEEDGIPLTEIVAGLLASPEFRMNMPRLFPADAG